MPRGVPNPKPAQPAPGQDEQAQGAFTLPKDMEGQRGAVLLLDACNVYGVPPDMSLPMPNNRGRGPFRGLLAWKFYPGDEQAGTPDSVALTTVGGLKIRFYADPEFPMDLDTENRLRNVFHAWKTDPKTNEIVPLPLPDDLTLSPQAVFGQVPKQGPHVYPGGYLRRKPDGAK